MTRLFVYSLIIVYLHVNGSTTTEVESQAAIVPGTGETCGGQICGNGAVCNTSAEISSCYCPQSSKVLFYDNSTRTAHCIDYPQLHPMIQDPADGTRDESTQTYDDLRIEAWGVYYYAIGGFLLSAIIVFIAGYVTHKIKKAKKAKTVPVVPEDDKNALTASDPLA